MPSVADIIVIAILVTLIAVCARSLYKSRKKGGCCGDCSACGGCCSASRKSSDK